MTDNRLTREEDLILKPFDYIVDSYVFSCEEIFDKKYKLKFEDDGEKVNWDDELRMEFQCQICLNYMYPPIQQCETGHCYCQDCFKKMLACPICECEITSTRNFVMEHIFEKLSFPCRYFEEGCTYGARGPVIRIHEKDCDYREIKCPFNTSSSCYWTGSQFSLKNHFTDTHSKNIQFGTNAEVVVSSFSACYRIERTKMFYAHGEVFYFSNILTTGYFKAAAFQLTQFTNIKYNFVVNIYDKDTRNKVITVEAPMKIVPENKWDTISSDYKPYFSWVVTYLQEFVNEEDVLKMLVKIKPVESD